MKRWQSGRKGVASIRVGIGDIVSKVTGNRMIIPAGGYDKVRVIKRIETREFRTLSRLRGSKNPWVLEGYGAESEVISISFKADKVKG